ncbi:DUF4326 domain-containing protein [Cylindrospermum sp. FACHB-282]|uniref:DUF4326 domain-containing protein n=1 Tax=Cylindrospermum sp. FACHB-282 TaxID=2692794 RepID=UPI00168A24F6|nr:DUF4326 domain-containing protein [Cylindrospermum sp. FACHB-282]MBD2386018.1 DUF4326 domain-containing protein [Cylindrospermum sp. FACHB-282]
MELIEVINGKTHGFLGKDKIYIGRANQSYNLPKSPLYNPYRIGEDGDRPTVCKKFDAYLYKKVKRWSETGEVDGEGTIMELLEICLKILELTFKADDEVEPIQLTCYCAPLQCHGSGIIRCAYWVIKQEWFVLAYKEYYP